MERGALANRKRPSDRRRQWTPEDQAVCRPPSLSSQNSGGIGFWEWVRWDRPQTRAHPGLVGHGLSGYPAASSSSSFLADTRSAVPSSWAKTDTLNSSSNQRNRW